MNKKLMEILCFVYGTQKESTKKAILDQAHDQIVELWKERLPSCQEIENEINMAIDRINKECEGKKLFATTRYSYVKEITDAIDNFLTQAQKEG